MIKNPKKFEENRLGYSTHFSKIHKLDVLDLKSRQFKAQKILSIIGDFASKKNKNLKELNCIDIGCSSGLIVINIADNFKQILGVDIDKKAVNMANKDIKKQNIKFEVMSGMDLKYPDESFDVVICNHVYEHVENYRKLFDEIHRILKKDGFCYLAAGNRYKIMESHYCLPFLSWLPRNLSNIYLRLMGKGKYYDEKMLSYFKLKKALKRFKINDYTIKVIKNPEKYFATDMIKPNQYIKYIPVRMLYFLLPTYLLILQKNK